MHRIIVNGQYIDENALQLESERLQLDPNLRAIPDETQRSAQVRAAAEHSLICRTLVEQTARADPRPIDPDLISKEVERQKILGGCRAGFDDSRLRAGIEMELRVNRTLADLVAGAYKPTEADLRAFHAEHGHNFRSPEIFHAAHIVKHVNEFQTEAQAREAIETALAELEIGEPFEAVAERWSDCKGNGGDLGAFPSGRMVQEFEDVLRTLDVGRRSGIFVTPFGFHIAELRGRQLDGSADFDSVRGDIERVLTTMAEHQALMMSVEALRLKADIQRVPVESEASNPDR
jgi:peptidyl-prolyl cis-trans isomerase C